MANTHIGGFLTGLVMGAVVGGAIGLLVAPYSGQATRDMVRDRGQALRDRAVHTVEDARTTVETAQQRGQATLAANVERAARTVEAAKRAAQATWQQGLAPEPPAADAFGDY